jgi:hypothetical protein
MAGKLIRESMNRAFDIDGLCILCFDLGLEFEQLRGETKSTLM